MTLWCGTTRRDAEYSLFSFARSSSSISLGAFANYYFCIVVPFNWISRKGARLENILRQLNDTIENLLSFLPSTFRHIEFFIFLTQEFEDIRATATTRRENGTGRLQTTSVDTEFQSIEKLTERNQSKSKCVIQWNRIHHNRIKFENIKFKSKYAAMSSPFVLRWRIACTSTAHSAPKQTNWVRWNRENRWKFPSKSNAAKYLHKSSGRSKRFGRRAERTETSKSTANDEITVSQSMHMSRAPSSSSSNSTSSQSNSEPYVSVFVSYVPLPVRSQPLSLIRSKTGSHTCQHMRRKIQRPDGNVSHGDSATKRIAARRPSNDQIETAIDKLEEIAPDDETGPPLPPRPPISRQRFSLSMETGKRSTNKPKAIARRSKALFIYWLRKLWAMALTPYHGLWHWNRAVRLVCPCPKGSTVTVCAPSQ